MFSEIRKPLCPWGTKCQHPWYSQRVILSARDFCELDVRYNSSLFSYMLLRVKKWLKNYFVKSPSGYNSEHWCYRWNKMLQDHGRDLYYILIPWYGIPTANLKLSYSIQSLWVLGKQRISFYFPVWKPEFSWRNCTTKSVYLETLYGKNTYISSRSIVKSVGSTQLAIHQKTSSISFEYTM